MNCMALELPCAPLGHIMDMFSPRSMSTSGGRPNRCKFNGVYAASNSTPRLTAWSTNTAKDFSEELARTTPSFSKSDLVEETLESKTPCSEKGLDEDSDSGHSSESDELISTGNGYTMPFASETFETVLLELKDEEEATKRALEADTSLSDCSDDSYDFGLHTIYSESPTLDRSNSRSSESECSQICCSENRDQSVESPPEKSTELSDNDSTVLRRVRFADHVRSSVKSRVNQKENIEKVKNMKSILKLSTANWH